MENKKNTGLIVLVIMLFIIILGLSGFIVYDKILNKTNNKNETKKVEKKEKNNVKKSIKIDETKEFVYDLVNKQIDGPAIGEKVELKLPYINIDSDYAKEVNKEISELQKNMEKNPKGGNVTYNFFENKNILSVLIVEETPIDYVYYYAYNISNKDGKYVSNKELLDIKNYKKDDVIEKLADFTIKTKYRDLSSGDYDHEIADTQYFAKGILAYPMYLNENNELCVMSYFSSVAGGLAPYSYIYNIDKNAEENLKLNR